MDAWAPIKTGLLHVEDRFISTRYHKTNARSSMLFLDSNHVEVILYKLLLYNSSLHFYSPNGWVLRCQEVGERGIWHTSTPLIHPPQDSSYMFVVNSSLTTWTGNSRLSKANSNIKLTFCSNLWDAYYFRDLHVGWLQGRSYAILPSCHEVVAQFHGAWALWHLCQTYASWMKGPKASLLQDWGPTYSS